MTGQLTDVLARRGPGYDLRPAESSPRTGTWGRVLDAATHRGPGYTPASAEELTEHEATARKARNQLAEFLHASFGRILAAKEALEAMNSATGPTAHDYRVSAEYELRGFLEYFHAEWPPAMAALRDAVGPLDLRTRYLIARLNRLQHTRVAEMERLADELAGHPGTPCPTAEPRTTELSFARATYVTAGEVRSLASLLHAAVR
ncbi:hypothetical protein [Kitasatospora sp. McL0602]|uniref:hypothetical protein n=1 Tax=Kitasatospora sp. McL0602 TaxID=3439530 RepID=UPI003F8BCB5C